MKRLLTALFSAILVLSLVGCGGKTASPEIPNKFTMQSDVKEFIKAYLGTDVEISYFTVEDESQDVDSLTAKCVATYENAEATYVDMFELSYTQSQGSWTLNKININDNYSNKSVAYKDGTSDATEDLDEASEEEIENTAAEDVEDTVEEDVATDTASESSEESSFSFADQEYIYFDDENLLLYVEPSIFGSDFQTVNQIFGNTLPATKSVDWWAATLGQNYDWTVYEDSDTGLTINLMFSDNKLEAVEYDRAQGAGTENYYASLLKAAAKQWGVYVAFEEFANGYDAYYWNIDDYYSYDIGSYQTDQNDTVITQRYGFWLWNSN